METSGGIQASLGGRYALALFELARDAKTIDTVEASLAAVRDALAQSEDFRALTSSPMVSRGAAAKAVTAVADSIGVDPTTRNFLGVLAENHRLAALPKIIRAFRDLAAQHRGEVSAEVFRLRQRVAHVRQARLDRVDRLRVTREFEQGQRVTPA